MEPHRIWIEQCEAARDIEDEFGTQHRQCTRDLLLVEPAREWLLAEEDEP